MTDTEKILAAIGELAVEVKANSKRLDGMEGRMESMEQEQKAMRQDISSLREDVSVMKEDMATVKQDVSALKEDVADLKAMQEEIWKDIARHDEKIAAVKEETDRLKLA